MPKWTQRDGLGSPSGTARSMYSPMLVRKAMTSWLVTASMASTSSLLKSARSRIQAASSRVMPILPISACASQASTSISCQMRYLFSREKMWPISGRV